MSELELNKRIEDELKVTIEGFTKAFEEEMEKTKAKVRKLNPKTIAETPTFSFASLAFEHNAPLKVLKVIEEMKIRYNKAKYFNKKVFGFLLDAEGKAYGYLAVNTKNYELRSDLLNKAVKCFDDANRTYGYADSTYNKAELAKKFNQENVGATWLEKYLVNDIEKFTRKGHLYMDLYQLADNARRKMEGKRLVISDQDNYELAGYYFEKGFEKKSLTAKFSFGLFKITQGETKKGLEMVNECYSEVKEYYSEFKKVLFASDYKVYKDAFNLIERDILKLKIKN